MTRTLSLTLASLLLVSAGACSKSKGSSTPRYAADTTESTNTADSSAATDEDGTPQSAGSMSSKTAKAEQTDVNVAPTSPSLAMTPDEEVLFAFDSDDLDVRAEAQIDELAVWAKGNPTRDIVIRGHSDANGPSDYNLALSTRRAQAVASRLRQAGVSEDQIIVAAVGETGAIKEPDSANRRAVIFISAPTDAAAQ
jgi:OmpA-OmpF porin, OOP family